MKLADVDLCALDQYETGVPHHVFKLLRAEAPVFRHAEPNGGPGFWAVTKYHDLMTVSKNPGTFSSYRGGTNIFDVEAEQLDRTRMIMLNMDPPAHSKYRKLVSQGFVPRIVSRL